jgi:lantibiotic modifying enzyme
MTISDEKFNAIVKAAASSDDFRRRKKSSDRPGAGGVRTSSSLREASSDGPRTEVPMWANELREMITVLAKFDFSSRDLSPLAKLCECGTRYGSQKLEAKVSSELLAMLSRKAKTRLEGELQRRIIRATKPCFTLDWNAFQIAFQAIHPQRESESPEMVLEKFLGRKPSHRLFPMFGRFPVLAKLWCLLIRQWLEEIAELLLRFSADRTALSRRFLTSRSADKIVDVRSGLSDPHNFGRTVMLLRLKGGSIIYKPRDGHGEQEWLRFIRCLNAKGLRPTLRAAKVLCRDGYCWMEEIKCAPCKDHAAARRFYRRLGATIAAAYFLRAVDCHRDNVIASGEHPVLIDAETLRHPSRGEAAQSNIQALFETGFVSASTERSSYQYRSSVLGNAKSGRHVPQIGSKRLNAKRYKGEIVAGFRRAWHCVFESVDRRTAFARHCRRLSDLKQRRVYWPTRNYDAIRQASIRPIALRSGTERDLLIAHFCYRKRVPSRVLRAEVGALRRLDIPYFRRRVAGRPVSDKRFGLSELTEALAHTMMCS